MSQSTHSKIQYLAARRKYEKILREQRWDVNSSHAVNAFVKPFTDVFKALKLTAMDIGNSARLMIGTLLTFDTKALTKKIDEFEERRNTLRVEWEPIVADSLNAIQTADPMLSFALMPNVYLAALGMATGIDTGKSAAEVVAGERWPRLINKLERFPTETAFLATILDKIDPDKGKVHQDGGILSKLTSLFFEGARPNSSLVEQKSEQKKYDTSSEEAWMKDVLQDLGLDQEFDDIAAESVKNHMTIAKDVMKAAQQAEAMALLVAADTIEEFTSALSSAKTEGLLEQSDTQEIENVISQIESQAKKLLKDEGFAEKAAQSKGVVVEKLSENDLLDVARKAAFNSAKTDFNQQVVAGSGNVPSLKSFMETVEKMKKETDIDNKTKQDLGKRTDITGVRELLQIYKTSDAAYDKARHAYATATGATKEAK